MSFKNAALKDPFRAKILSIIKTKRNYAENVRYYLKYLADKNIISDFELKLSGNKFHVIIRTTRGTRYLTANIKNEGSK